MTNIGRKLPAKIVEIIEGEHLSRDSFIYYTDDQGWVYQRRDDNLVHSQRNILERVQSSSFSVEHTLASSASSVDDARPLKTLGPFGTQVANVSVTLVQGTDMYETSFNRRLSKLAEYENIECIGQHAPLAPVTLVGTARDVAHIPRDATHFCWVYPPTGLTQLCDDARANIDREVSKGDPAYTFFALGGFVYFRLDQGTYTTLQANALVQAESGLVFNGPFKWRSAYTAHLAKQGRFQARVYIYIYLEIDQKNDFCSFFF
ncbi:unnamed protein product [Rotaria sp. Silwood1]|nr:unnamed protein product [Rotaria sp. Silwood1]CAF3367882.1 unnamed protein product [Rotaria sp. Silwood1]CAF3402284.1 unnamed protein product [Rotaria sp. Silwood1]CAF4623378.1 unnamed protein product [Rotaria sp. Silwood1]CAF4656899.1 unnamed protein product [Rotaria sp. Silwood1]